MMRRGTEDTGDGDPDLIVLGVFHHKFGTAAGAFELDDVARKRQRADNAEDRGAAFGTAIRNGSIFGL